MRLVFIILLFATTAQAQFIINPYVFAGAGVAVLNAYATEQSIYLTVDEYVDVSDDNTLSFGNGTTDVPVTFSAWIYTVGSSGARNDFATFYKNTEYDIYFDATTPADPIVTAKFIDQSTGGIIGRSYNCGDIRDEWTHVSVVYSGSGLASGIDIYINGVLVDDTDASSGSYTAMENSANALWLGRNATDYIPFGNIDQVAIWDTILSVSEIKEMMAIRDYNYHSQADNIISWWDFDSDDTTTNGITDLIGTNNGTGQNITSTAFVYELLWPYTYQLDSNAVWDSITPMQYAFTDSIFGGFAWDYDGSAEYIRIADADSLSHGDGTADDPFSISAWVQMDDATGFYILSKDTTSELEWVLNVGNSDQIYFRLEDQSTGGRIRCESAAITSWEGQWVNITATYSGNESQTGLTVYLNGADVTDTRTLNPAGYVAMENQTGTVNIGRNILTPDYSDGRIGDVILWNKELSAAEVLAIYNDHEPRNETYESLSANITGYWRGYNSTNVSNGVIDQSGNSFTGTPQSMDNIDFTYSYPREVLDSVGSFDFDGSNEYIDCGDSDDFSFTDGAGDDEPFSICAWVNASDYTNKRIAGKNGEYLFFTGSGDQLFLNIYDAEGDRISRRKDGTITSYQGAWTFLCGCYTGNNSNTGITLYINGNPVYDFSNQGAGVYGGTTNTANSFNIAEYNGSYIPAEIAHVTVANIFLNRQQIEELYNDGSPVDITKVTFAANVVSHWKMDQTDDPTGTVTDIVGTNNGTGQNMEAGDLKTDSYPTN